MRGILTVFQILAVPLIGALVLYDSRLPADQKIGAVVVISAVVIVITQIAKNAT
jgi:hypothetical protein